LNYLLESAQAPRALDEVDFAAIQGNFAIYSGLKPTNAFALEKMATPYINAPWFTQALGDYLHSKPTGLSQQGFCASDPAGNERRDAGLPGFRPRICRYDRLPSLCDRA
jgi:NlpA lipoprotein